MAPYGSIFHVQLPGRKGEFQFIHKAVLKFGQSSQFYEFHGLCQPVGQSPFLLVQQGNLGAFSP